MSAKTIWFAVALAALLATAWAAPRKQNVNEDKAFQEMFMGNPLLRSLKLFAFQYPTKETTESKPSEKDKIHIITYPVYQPQQQHPAPPHHYYPPPPQHQHTPPPAHHNPPPSYHHPPPPSYHPSPPSSHHPAPPAGIQIPPYLWSQLANSGFPIIIINTTSIGAANIVEQAPAETTRSIYRFNVPPPSEMVSDPALIQAQAEAEPEDYIADQPSQDVDTPEDTPEYDEEDIEEPKFAAVQTTKGTKIVGHSKNPILEAILARDRRRKRVQERVAAAFYLRNYNANRK